LESSCIPAIPSPIATDGPDTPQCDGPTPGRWDSSASAPPSSSLIPPQNRRGRSVFVLRSSQLKIALLLLSVHCTAIRLSVSRPVGPRVCRPPTAQDVHPKPDVSLPPVRRPLIPYSHDLLHQGGVRDQTVNKRQDRKKRAALALIHPCLVKTMFLSLVPR